MITDLSPADGTDVLIALRDIHSCQDIEHPEQEILKLLAKVFSFDYTLLLSSERDYHGEIWFEAKFCGGQRPVEAIDALRFRSSSEGTPFERTLRGLVERRTAEMAWYDPAQSGPWLPVACPLEPHDPPTGRLCLLPLPDRAGNVERIVVACLRAGSLADAANPRFGADLQLLSSHAGIAIENIQLHRKVQRLAGQRDQLMQLGLLAETLPTLDRKLLFFLTWATCGRGLRFNRALLFLQGLDGRYHGTCGIAAQSAAHYALLHSEVGEWGLERYLDDFRERQEHGARWPNPVLRKMALEQPPDSPAKVCLDSLAIKFCEGDTAPDPSFRESGLYIPGTSYALLPVTARGTKLGLLYLDNTYSHERIDLTSLQILGLGEYLGNLIRAAGRTERQEQVRTALARVVSRVAPLLKGENDTDAPLYRALFETFGELGAQRACVVSRSPEGEWHRLAPALKWEERDDFWQESLEAVGEHNSISGGTRLHTADPFGGHVGRRLLIAFLPFPSAEKCYALCMEPADELEIDAAFTQAISTLAALAAAILASAEHARFLKSSLAKFSNNSDKAFATSAFRMTTHEAKNVLHALGVQVDALNDRPGDLTPRQRAKFSSLQARVKAGSYALKTYLGFLDVIEKRKTDEPVNIGSIAREVRGLLAPHIVAMGRITDQFIQIAPEADHYIVDLGAANLSIVLFNLLSNALKAVREVQEPSIQVEAKFLADKGVIHLIVIDNGCGITADEKMHIFEPHYSGFARRETKQTDGGEARSSGVGLLGVRMLLEKNKGTIQLNSGNGKTEALVVLPGRKG